MQANHIMAFRKRLKKRGYTNVSIKKIKDKEGIFVISAVEPLANTLIIHECSESYFFHSFKF